jgi:1-phosphofructokinase
MADRVVRVTPPELEAVDHRGAGDSMSAGLAAGHLLGLKPLDAVRLGAAAGAGNVTRRGLGSGSSELIAELLQLVDVEDIA